MPGKPPPAFDPQPHPRDILENEAWFRRNGADELTAMLHAQERHYRWRIESSHFWDGACLAGALIVVLVIIALSWARL